MIGGIMSYKDFLDPIFITDESRNTDPSDPFVNNVPSDNPVNFAETIDWITAIHAYHSGLSIYEKIFSDYIQSRIEFEKAMEFRQKQDVSFQETTHQLLYSLSLFDGSETKDYVEEQSQRILHEFLKGCRGFFINYYPNLWSKVKQYDITTDEKQAYQNSIQKFFANYFRQLDRLDRNRIAVNTFVQEDDGELDSINHFLNSYTKLVYQIILSLCISSPTLIAMHEQVYLTLYRNKIRKMYFELKKHNEDAEQIIGEYYNYEIDLINHFLESHQPEDHPESIRERMINLDEIIVMFLEQEVAE